MTMEAAGDDDRATGDVPVPFTFEGVRYLIENNTGGVASVGEGPGQVARRAEPSWCVWRCDEHGKRLQGVATFEAEPKDEEDLSHLIKRAKDALIDQGDLMNTRTWTDPSGRTWEISIALPPGAALAVPLDWPKGNPTESPQALYIRFTDPANPVCHPSVPYTSGKSLSQLTDAEIAGFWCQVLATHPELRVTTGP